MNFVMILIVGAAAGFLATRFMRVQLDVVTTVLIGVVGAGVSWFVLRLIYRLMGSGVMLIGAIAGAMALIWLWQKYFNR
ncbi:GlsB/YeaQ/YmgE family stress response membrane protein [Gemmobacter serpentinus]|uniref:GlsB/YeaQ/YmgE family stress response membrane protein n=1 Tax=Gemmobacter serpentinus TaxID=2652247 RepID=UPI00124C2A69|nr:GlsB/YeaQ/YmgE family stress response membrane protein [Gemmobacter serpentinus]